MAQGSRRRRASASACPAPARSRAVPSTLTASTSRRCAAPTTSWRRSSNALSMTTSSTSTPDADLRLLDALHRVWGFSEFRPLQREAMHAILEARDSVVVLPTGGGKSLCFQAPAIVDHPRAATDDSSANRDRRGLAIVVPPLISLMKDQGDALRVDGVAASYLNSTLQPHERDAVLASVREDRCRMLYVSPERLVGEGTPPLRRRGPAGDGSPPLRRMRQQASVRFIAIDESHCISQWGHDFRPEYRQLGRLRE